MATKQQTKKGIKDTEGGNFGGYDEYNGGGSPKGGIWGGTNGRVGWKKRENMGEVKQSEHRQGQPRTNDGKFTYNSVNGKETKYESRGETVNPLLTGGKNGVKISDVEAQFKAKKGTLYDKYKNDWYERGSERVSKDGRKYKVQLANDAIWNIAKRSFDVSKGEFTGESTTFAESKKGARGKDEKAAIAEARKAKASEQFVKSANGGIKQHGNVAAAQPGNTGIQFQMHPSVLKRIALARLASTQAGMQSIVSGQAGPKIQAAGTAGTVTSKPTAQLTLAHSPEQIKALRNVLTKMGKDVSKFTDQQIDNMFKKRG